MSTTHIILTPFNNTELCTQHNDTQHHETNYTDNHPYKARYKSLKRDTESE